MSTVWLMTSRYAAMEVAQYRNSWCALCGRVAQVVFWGSCSAAFLGFTLVVLGLGECQLDVATLYLGSGTVFFASLKRDWEASLFLGGIGLSVLFVLGTSQLGWIPRNRALGLVLFFLPIIAGTVLFFWARRRTAGQSERGV